MKTWLVLANGTEFGEYAGDTEQEAKDACARDAGYESESHMEFMLDEPSALEAQLIEEKGVNRADLNLYLVSEGEVTPCAPNANWDGINSILVAATSEDAALRVADAYDAGLIRADNLIWDGRTLAVVSMVDPDTGNFW